MVVHLFHQRVSSKPGHRNRRSGRVARSRVEPLESRAYLSAALSASAVSAASVTSVSNLSFAAPIQVVTGPGVVAAAAGDFNNDGHADLTVLSEGGFPATGNVANTTTAAAPTGDAVVSVLLGKGDGTFRAPINTLVNVSNLTNLNGAGGPVFLGQPAVGDFNGDGRLDLAFAVQGNLANTTTPTFASGGAVIALPGNGDGTFGSPQLVSNTPGIPLGGFNADGATGTLIGSALFNPAGVGVVSIGSTNGIAFIPSGNAGGFVITSPGMGIPGSGTIGLGTFGSGNVFGGPVDNGGSSFGNANGAFVATGLPTTTGGTQLGVLLGTASSPVLTSGTFATQTTLTTLGTPTGNEAVVGNLPTFTGTTTTFPSSLGNLPTFTAGGTFNTAGLNTTGINTLPQSQVQVGTPLVPDTGTLALTTQGATGTAGPLVPTGAVASTPGGNLVILRSVNFGSAGTLAGVPGFTNFAGGLPIGFSAAGPFVVSGDFNGDSKPDLAVFNPAADSLSILLNTTASAKSAKSAKTSAALASLARPKAAAAGAVQFIPALTDVPTSLSPGPTKATVTVSLINNGSTTATASVKLELFTSTGQGVEPGQAPLVSVTKRLRLTAQQAKSIKLKLGKVPPLADGSYYLVAQVTEPDGSVAVAPSARPVKVAAPFVDLSAGFAAATPTSLRQGKLVTVPVKVTNAGTATAAGTVSVDLSASTNPAGDSMPIALTTTKLRVRLSAGASRVVRVRFKAPAGLAGGTPFYFVAGVGLSGGAVDSNAANDVAVSGTPFTVA